jgi:hypothetical protein
MPVGNNFLVPFQVPLAFFDQPAGSSRAAVRGLALPSLEPAAGGSWQGWILDVAFQTSR